MFNPSNQLATRPMSVTDFMKQGYFEIPANQRTYRWGVNQWKKLWDDIVATLVDDYEDRNGLTPSKNPSGHFMGAVVLIGKDTCHHNDRWLIIDGQQRLTTISILASCLMQFIDCIEERRTRRSMDGTLLEIFASNSGADLIPRIVLNREDVFYYGSINEN